VEAEEIAETKLHHPRCLAVHTQYEQIIAVIVALGGITWPGIRAPWNVSCTFGKALLLFCQTDLAALYLDDAEALERIYPDCAPDRTHLCSGRCLRWCVSTKSENRDKNTKCQYNHARCSYHLNLPPYMFNTRALCLCNDKAKTPNRNIMVRTLTKAELGGR